MQQLYALFLDLRQKRILVVGAGAVAARKVRSVLECGATDVRVVAPTICPEMPLGMAGITAIRRPFAEADLDGVDLCFAATDSPEVNSLVVRLCRQRHILVNRADRAGEVEGTEPADGDFTVPAMLRRGAISVAVSASGAPRLAASVRDHIGTMISGDWEAFAEVMIGIRRRVVAMTHQPQGWRASVLRELASPEAFAAFRDGGEAELERYLNVQFPELGVRSGH